MLKCQQQVLVSAEHEKSLVTLGLGLACLATGLEFTILNGINMIERRKTVSSLSRFFSEKAVKIVLI